MKLVRKRDGQLVPFDDSRIKRAIFYALAATGNPDKLLAEQLKEEVVRILETTYGDELIPDIEDIQDVVEKVLMKRGETEAAKHYILYRKQHQELRDFKELFKTAINLVDNYLEDRDWRIRENSNMSYSLQGLNFHVSSSVIARYWLTKIYPEDAGKAHVRGDIHIHDLGILGPYCVGWDLEDLLRRGFGGVPGKISSKPAKHFRTALGQIVNFFYTLQGEAAGAQALSNFDTLLAPFVRYDNLSYKELKQALQEFLFNVNIPTRVGFQTPFSNLTFDLTVSPLYRDRLVIVGGKERAVKYEEFQHEMDMINRAFIELMMEGDANGRIFTFPIPTYNITKDFDWDNPSLIPLWELTGKYGVPYFSNFVNSDMKPEDARSMCCRLRLDNRELRKRGGGLFGANPLTGSIGVVTINLPRIGYISRTEGEFFHRLTELMEIAKKALETKRKILERFTEKGLYPYSKVYLEPIKKLKGAYWANHFSTIGLIGVNEAVENFLGIPFFSKEGKEFAKRVLNYMREILQEFQGETGNLYNLEATPAEGASYRLAKKDLEYFPDIKIQGTKDEPYYTNSVHLPVQATDDIFEILEFEDDLQILFTGGTVVHLFIGESIFDPNLVKNLVRKIVTNYRLPYFSITPCFSISPVSGFLPGVHYYDPNPHPKEVIEKYGVVVEMDEEDLAKLPQGSYIVIEDEAARTVHQPSLFLGIDLNKSGK